MNRAGNPYNYVADPTKGRPLFNSDLYFGVPDLDPEVPANQIQVYLQQEDGTPVAVSQPVETGAGGVPMYNGSPAIILIGQDAYSFKALDRNGTQVYYQENAEATLGGGATVGSLENYAAVRALNGSNFSQVSVAGRDSSGDGGGRIFYADQSDLSTNDNGSTVIVDASGLRWKAMPPPASAKKKNVLWMGEFGAWDNGNALRVGDVYRAVIGGGATFARSGFTDNQVTIFRIKGDKFHNGVRVQRDAGSSGTSPAVVVMNLTQSESKPVIGGPACFQVRLRASSEYTGSGVSISIQYSEEMEQPITRGDGTYSNGNVIAASALIIPTQSYPEEVAPYYVFAEIPNTATQVSATISVNYSGVAPAEDYIEFEAAAITSSYGPDFINEVGENEYTKISLTRYQSSYPKGAPRGSNTVSGARQAICVGTSTTSAVADNIEFSPKMAVPPQFIFQSPTSGTESRMLNETTGSNINGLAYGLSESGVTVRNNAAVSNGDRVLYHWTAICAF